MLSNLVLKLLYVHYMNARTNFVFLRMFCNNRLKFVNLRIGLAGTEATFAISEFLKIVIVSTGQNLDF